MNLLTDGDLRAKVGAQPAELIEGVDLTTLEQQVHGCAVEIHIGDIFRPGSEQQSPGSATCPRERYSLAEGETAVIRTLEAFKLGTKHTALVLPVGSVSLQGLLMTNPGQVDPGYHGQVHVTVINMGRQPYMLKRGDRLLRALLFELDKDVLSPYKQPTPTPESATTKGRVVRLLRSLLNRLDAGSIPRGGTSGPINQELLETLAPDFLSVSARGNASAKREIDRALLRDTFWQYLLPVILVAATAGISTWASNHAVTNEFKQRLADLESEKSGKRLERLESSFPNEKRLDSVEESVRRIQEELERRQTQPR